MAISVSNLSDVIKHEMREWYHLGLKGFCTNKDIEANGVFHWFPRTCCAKQAKFDKRTPCLFKLEYQGQEMIGLCIRTYIVRKTKVIRPSSTQITARGVLHKATDLNTKLRRLQSRRVHEYKFSSKGVSKCHLKGPIAKFRSVLKTSRALSGLTRGF